MVALHITKYSQIVFLSLLLISLSSFCADDNEGQQIAELTNITFSCNIPGLNAPLQFERTDESIHKIALVCAAVDHGRLLCKQLKSQQNVQDMLIDHAVLAAFRITIGLTSTICHEFGHAICRHYNPYATLESITLQWSPANVLLGAFDGGYSEGEVFSINAEKDDDQSIEIQYANMIGLLNKDKDMYCNRMINCATGPLLGALSAYMIYKSVESGYPSLTYGFIAFSAIGNHLANLVPASHLSSCIENRLIATRRNEQEKRELEQKFAEVKIPGPGADGDQFYEAWHKRKKTQEKIDKFKKAYDEYKTGNSVS